MRHTEAMVTIELADGVGGVTDERDVLVRAFVERCRLYGGSMGYRIDGDVEAFVGGRWVDLVAGKRDMEIASEAICDAAELEGASEPSYAPEYWRHA